MKRKQITAVILILTIVVVLSSALAFSLNTTPGLPTSAPVPLPQQGNRPTIPTLQPTPITEFNWDQFFKDLFKQ